MSTFTIAIHGGAGTIVREHMKPEQEKIYLQALQAAVDMGFNVLKNGGTAIDAVVAATIILEDDALFNAGRGSVFTKDGKHEMDASIMDGATLDAGAVAGVRNIRNPVVLALEVMRNSDHVFLSGQGANDFAAIQNIKIEPDEYFFSDHRHKQWQEMQESGGYSLDHSNKAVNLNKERKFGTVGAVACDANGNIAAATSTGGMTNKKFGRIGDTPVIGSGNYANNATCAISCTGHGEIFLRAVAAYDVSCLMEYQGKTLQEAMDIVVHEKLMKIQGDGGMIGVDAKGNAVLVFNSEGMYRGMKSSDGKNKVAIYND
jgi:beta-aspartyl-peptidase (threonine type)